MRAAVIVFPASNCDRDVAVALGKAIGSPAQMVWHGGTELPDVDLVVLPGGFSYGDYLRCGAMAAQSPIMRAVVERAKKGGPTLGICNGFQILTETGLLPGAMLSNASLKFVCRDVNLRVENAASIFTSNYQSKQTIQIPVAHHDGNYFADADTLDQLEQNDQVAFRYCADVDRLDDVHNPNGSIHDIAGILNDSKNVLGMMPHPERVVEASLGGIDGLPLFTSLVEAL
jgi:phosphoribosylformylglycinamidine synthase